MSVERLLVGATVADLGAVLRRREVSAPELAEASLERLERLGPRFNALAALLPERALREARQAQRDLDAGRDRGPLHGIPYGAKDLLAARGAPTTWGAEPYRDQVFREDAAVVRRLRQAGAVLVAKLAMLALAGGGGYRFPHASLQGPGRNPWQPDHWTGGSSSGSGAAVAARLVPFALGSETSGSILTPAAFCGVAGLRPTYGLVSRRGAMPLAWSLDKVGPLATTAADCGEVLRAIAGRDAGDPGSVAAPRLASVRPDGVRGLRVGYAPVDFEEHAAPEIRPALAEALRALRALGVVLVEAELPPDLGADQAVWTIIAAEGSAVFADLVEDGRVEQLWDERQKAGLRAGLEVTARDYLAAMRVRVRVQRAFRDLFQRVDVLLGPGRPVTAPHLDQPLDALRRLPESDRPGNSALIPAGNAAGLPALGFPGGFSPDHLPVGLQVVGPPFSEERLLALGAAFQAATAWHQRLPPGCEAGYGLTTEETRVSIWASGEGEIGGKCQQVGVSRATP